MMRLVYLSLSDEMAIPVLFYSQVLLTDPSYITVYSMCIALVDVDRWSIDGGAVPETSVRI